MKNAAMSEVFLCAGMLLLHDLSSKGDTALACLGLNELQELPAGQVPGMSSHKVKKLSFLFRIAEIPECFRMNGQDFHKAKILALISCVSRTRRSFAWSCCRANRWNPALAF